MGGTESENRNRRGAPARGRRTDGHEKNGRPVSDGSRTGAETSRTDIIELLLYETKVKLILMMNKKHVQQ